MNCKTVKKLLSLRSAIILFGVYSVSSNSFAYPLTKAPAPSSTFQKNTSKSNDIDPESKPVKETTRSGFGFSSQHGSPFSPGTHNLALSVGQVFLMGDLSSRYENALGTELHYTYGVSDLFSFESNFGYSSHSGQVNGATASLLHLATGIRTNLIYFDQLVPYFSAGLGFYNLSETRSIDGKTPNGATFDVSGLLFGLQLGGGAELLLSNNIFFGAGLTYNTMFAATKKASNNNLVSMGGSLISFLVHVGFTF